jgi:hypothetical protein
MKMILLTCLLALSISTVAKAQITAPAPSASVDSIEFNVTACQTERIGPFQMRSGNWELVDSIIAQLGNEKALAYFKQRLHVNRSATFYALIGIYKTGGSSEFENAMASVSDEVILFQEGCLMVRKLLTEAVRIALF